MYACDQADDNLSAIGKARTVVMANAPEVGSERSDTSDASRHPIDRYQSMDELQSHLELFQRGSSLAI